MRSIVTTLAVLAALAGCAQRTDPVSYRPLAGWREEGFQVSAAVISPEAFDQQGLLATFRAFLDDSFQTNSVYASLFLATDVRLLYGSGSIRVNDDPVSPEIFAELTQTGKVAGMLRLGNNAIVVIRDGPKVSKIQLLGDKDPRIIQVGGTQVQLIPAWVSNTHALVLYAAAMPLLSELEAGKLFASLKAELAPKEPRLLLIRTSPPFGKGSGPIFDIFSTKLAGSQQNGEIVCSSVSDGRTGLRKGCHVE